MLGPIVGFRKTSETCRVEIQRTSIRENYNKTHSNYANWSTGHITNEDRDFSGEDTIYFRPKIH